MWKVLAAAVAAVLVMGCGDGATATGPKGLVDAAQPDGAAQDVTAQDVADAEPDAETPPEDTLAPELPDTAVPDAGDAEGDLADAQPAPENTCCELSDAPGCADPAIMDCVCAHLPVCCDPEDGAWTGKCVEAATVLCFAGCGAAGPGPGDAECGDGVCGPDESCASCPGDCGFCAGSGDCCAPHDAPACASQATTQCVCDLDAYCCQVEWDALCVEQAADDCAAGCAMAPQCGDGVCDDVEDCGACPADCGPCDPGDCCQARADAGCEVPSLEACVCQADPFCCATAWDSLCVLGAIDTCAATCDAPAPTCGDGLCDGAESCATCPDDCGACGGGDCCDAADAPGCGDPAVEACVCADDTYCCQVAWDDQCADAAPACGAACAGDLCECAWAPDGCGAQTALLEIVPLDVWAQPLPDAALTVTGPDGEPLASAPGGVFTVPLCGKTSLAVDVSAALHDPLVGTLAYAGGGGPGALTWKSAAGQPKTAWSLTTDLRQLGDQQVRHYTLYAGLAHRWFAPSGRPPRHGTRLTLLRDGEEAWATVAAELTLATERVNASSWWWTSDVEVLRDPALHPWLPSDERWLNTIMGRLEALEGVARRVLVGQFYSQDGLLSGVTIDDALEAKATTPADDFEFMGMANEAHGKFTVTPQPVDFAARVLASDAPTAAAPTPVAAAPHPAFSPPIQVNTSAVPLGLGWLNLPIASWHQKFLTIDGQVSFVGGMNFKTTDWDTSDHLVFDPLRMAFDASSSARQKVMDKLSKPSFTPRKDYMARLDGPAAADVEAIFHTRWQHQLAADVQHADLSTPFTPAAPSAPFADGQQVQVVATMPAPFDDNAILDALLRAVSQATDYIFIEDQYFRAPILVDRIAARMAEVPGLVLIVVTNPINEWVDPGCFQTYKLHQQLAAQFPTRYRTYATRSFDYVDTDCTFCIDEVDAHFVPHSLHSKLVVIDDVWLEVGSCNSNNRGLLYEGELAVVTYDPPFVAAQRDAIFANLIGDDYVPGTPPAQLIAAFDARAKANQAAYDAWDDDGMDLNLNGAPVPAKYLPEGFIYPLAFGHPDDCFIENVGPDVM